MSAVTAHPGVETQGFSPQANQWKQESLDQIFPIQGSTSTALTRIDRQFQGKSTFMENSRKSQKIVAGRFVTCSGSMDSCRESRGCIFVERCSDSIKYLECGLPIHFFVRRQDHSRLPGARRAMLPKQIRSVHLTPDFKKEDCSLYSSQIELQDRLHALLYCFLCRKITANMLFIPSLSGRGKSVCTSVSC